MSPESGVAAATGLLMPPDQPYLNGRDGTTAQEREREGGTTVHAAARIEED